MKATCELILQELAQCLYDKKAMNIIALDMKELAALSDYLLIAEGKVARHVKALSEEIAANLKEKNIPMASIESDLSSDWMVIDTYDIMIHILTPEMRRRYALEQFWSKAKIVPLDLS